MVYQVATGTTVAGRTIKVPQTFISRLIRSTIIAETAAATQQLNVLHFAAPVAPVTLDDCQNVNTMLLAWLTSEYAPLYSSQVTALALHTRSMEGLIVPEATMPVEVPGTLTGEALPYHVSQYVSFNTGLTGRKNRGGFHVFSPDETVNASNGFPSSTYTGNCLAALQALLTSADSAGYPVVVASFSYSTFQPVATPSAFVRWGSVDSRKLGHGR